MTLKLQKNCFKKVQKCNFFSFKMAAISSMSTSFEVIFPDHVFLIPSNVPTTFRWNDQDRFGEKCKKVIFYMQIGHHFAGSWAVRPILCTAHQDHTRYVSAKYHWDLFKNEGARAGTKVRAHILDPVAAAASKLSKTYSPT